MPAPAPAVVLPTATHTAAVNAADAASTASLIKQIAAEARSSGKSLTFDPETGQDGADAADPEAPATRGKDGKFQKPTKPKVEKVEEDGQTETEGDEETDPEGEAESEGDEETESEPGVLDTGAITAALESEGGVDMIALAKALGKEPEELGVSPAQHKAIRLGQKKAMQTLTRAQQMADKLQKQYGDRVAAKKALQDGDLQPAISCVEAIFDMSWNDLNKAVAATLAGKPLPELEGKRELRDLKKKEAERLEADKKAAEDKAATERTEAAKTFINQKIKGDKLASPELAKTLKDAGLPSITDLVFAELQAGFSKGLTDPRAALDKVRARLQKQAKALAAAGLVAVPDKTGKPAVSVSRPRERAQAGAAGNSREMSDAELRASVLKEHGLGPRR